MTDGTNPVAYNIAVKLATARTLFPNFREGVQGISISI